MVSSLGYSVAASCAASRAGILRISELEECRVWDDESGRSEPARGHMIPSVTGGFTGLGRLAALGSAALKDLGSAMAWSDNPRSALFVATSNDFHRSLLEQQGEMPAASDARRAYYAEHLIPIILKALRIQAVP